jgi:hypothetical protein
MEKQKNNIEVSVLRLRYDKDKENILKCPFCRGEIWFTFSEIGKTRFKHHVIKEHLNELVDFIISNSVKKVMKSNLRWCLKQ